jgi:hypothetical protein
MEIKFHTWFPWFLLINGISDIYLVHWVIMAALYDGRDIVNNKNGQTVHKQK